MANYLSGADYLSIANAFANARLAMLSAIEHFQTPVDVAVLSDDLFPTLDLPNEMHRAQLLNTQRLNATLSFDAAVRSVNQHVLDRSDYASIQDYIQAEIIDTSVGQIPEQWQHLSAQVGYVIPDSQIVTSEAGSSSSSSSSSSSDGA
jgi:hypothetical protein